MPEPVFFESQDAFRRWLEANHARETELIVGFHKKSSGRGGLTPDQALEEALCFGWIDGVRRTIDPQAFSNRYTPRRKSSHWSQVNIAKMEALIAAGRVHPSGVQAFEARDKTNSQVRYSSEAPEATLDPDQERQLRERPEAWAFWSVQPAHYRKVAAFWVTSAKREETRQRRLATLIEDCANRRRIALVVPAGRRT